MAKDKFEKTRDFVEEKIDQTKEFLGDSFEKTRDRMGDAWGDVRKGFNEVSSRIDDVDWADVPEDVRRYVRKNPVLSLGLAAGFGLLVGYLLGRRDD